MKYTKLPRNAAQMARIDAAIPRLKKIELLPVDTQEKSAWSRRECFKLP